jgi:hypothetical protein
MERSDQSEIVNKYGGKLSIEVESCNDTRWGGDIEWVSRFKGENKVDSDNRYMVIEFINKLNIEYTESVIFNIF